MRPSTRPLPANKRSQRLKDLKRQKCFYELAKALECNLKDFVKVFWPILEPTTTLQWNWHLDLLCDYLTAVTKGEYRRLIINVPPRSMKSLLCTVFYPVWRWCTEPQRRFMCVSYSEILSTDHSIFRRNVMNSKRYRNLWGHKVKFSIAQNRKAQYENTRRGLMFSTSITGSATGKGCDELIVDDPLNAQNAFSDLERDKTNRNFDATFRSRLNDPANGVIIVIMQRLHDRDLSGHLLQREPNAWSHIKLPAEFEQDARWEVKGRSSYERKAGDLLWEDRFPRSVLQGFKTALGSWSYSGQYQQDPTPLEGALIKREWIKYYRELPAVASGQWIQSWDCTFKETREADYVVGQVWLKIGSSLYLVDQVRARMDFVTTAQAIRNMTARYPQATAKLIEDKANGPAVIASLKREISGLIAIAVNDTKAGRLNSVSPYFEAGNVFLPEGKAWVGDFVEEITHFPKAAHDDQVDACTQAIMHLCGPNSGIFDYYTQWGEKSK